MPTKQETIATYTRFLAKLKEYHSKPENHVRLKLWNIRPSDGCKHVSAQALYTDIAGNQWEFTIYIFVQEYEENKFLLAAAYCDDKDALEWFITEMEHAQETGVGFVSWQGVLAAQLRELSGEKVHFRK